MATCYFPLIAAIDFGTTYSGWAYSFGHDFERDPTIAYVKHWSAGTGTLVTEKIPTCLLVKPDGKTFHGFGYDAENKYRELVEKKEHAKYYYFRHFKMALMQELGKGLTRELTLKEEMGKEMLAVDVFSMSINFLKEDLMEVVNRRLASVFKEDEIHWVLTVPAIWSDAAKQFMKEAAVKAGIWKEILALSLEPEAASLFCRQIPLDRPVNAATQTIAQLKDGTKYIVLDAGGGTVDITVHEVQSAYTLREVSAATGGGWGGQMVNEAFENFLIRLSGNDVYEEFKATETEDWLDLFRYFELSKREVTCNKEGKVAIRFPSSLSKIVQRRSGKSLEEYIQRSEYRTTVEIKNDKMRIAKSLMHSFFTESVENVIEHLRSMDLKDVNLVLMVGGFSESLLLQKRVKEAFTDKKVVIPHGASSAVLRGALISGHRPESVTERILRYTYGIEVNDPFDADEHPISKLIKYSDGDRCCQVFDRIVQVNTSIKTNMSLFTKTYSTLEKNQQSVLFKMYATRQADPKYVDDNGCVKIGEIRLVFDKSEENKRYVNLIMMFGGTEIVVEAEDQKTGKKSRAVLDFLG